MPLSPCTCAINDKCIVVSWTTNAARAGMRGMAPADVNKATCHKSSLDGIVYYVYSSLQSHRYPRCAEFPK
jgi:hypothetical protein